jgi:hypothetical protein
MGRAGILAGLALALAATATRPSISVRDLDGRVWTPLAPAAGDTHLLVFISADCPISNRYAPEIDRIAGLYGGRRVRTFLVYADSTAESARTRAHLNEFHPSLRGPAIIDKGLTLSEAAGATVTPEAMVFTRAGRAYRGRIDDLYVNAGQSRRAARQHDLRDALDAVVAGRLVAQPETKPIGCFIEWGTKR